MRHWKTLWIVSVGDVEWGQRECKGVVFFLYRSEISDFYLIWFLAHFRTWVMLQSSNLTLRLCVRSGCRDLGKICYEFEAKHFYWDFEKLANTAVMYWTGSFRRGSVFELLHDCTLSLTMNSRLLHHVLKILMSWRSHAWDAVRAWLRYLGQWRLSHFDKRFICVIQGLTVHWQRAREFNIHHILTSGRLNCNDLYITRITAHLSSGVKVKRSVSLFLSRHEKCNSIFAECIVPITWNLLWLEMSLTWVTALKRSSLYKPGSRIEILESAKAFAQELCVSIISVALCLTVWTSCVWRTDSWLQW